MIHLEQKVCGFYKLEAVKKSKSGKETKRLLADWFPNLITTAGLNYMGTNRSYAFNTSTRGGWLTYCIVGSGNTTPAFTDSVLANKLAATSSMTAMTLTVESTSPYYRKMVLKYRFAEGVAAGNLAEVGIGWSSTACFSRALILDGGGNPTTITILSDEYLDVTYEYRIYPKETDDTGTVIFTGNLGGTYDWIARLARATTWCLDANNYKQLSMQVPCRYFYNYPSTSTIQAITGYPVDNLKLRHSSNSLFKDTLLVDIMLSLLIRVNVSMMLSQVRDFVPMFQHPA